MAVMIGTGLHKGSRTGVAVGGAERPLGTLRVRGRPEQGREAGRLGAGLAGADVGGGGPPCLVLKPAWELVLGEQTLGLHGLLGGCG
jgi:hypothetical protein